MWQRLTSSLGRALRLPRLAHQILIQRSLGHPCYISNPYPLYAWLRRHAPVRVDPIVPVYTVTRYADVATVFKDSRFRRKAAEHVSDPATEEKGSLAPQMLFLDPPRHTRIRSLFAKAFTPASISALRPRIRLIAEKRLDRVASSGRMDLIADFAAPVPVFVIAELLGFPPEDYLQIKEWSEALTAGLFINASAEVLARSSLAVAEISNYFDQVVESKKRKPGDDLLTRLLNVEDEGRRLTPAEMFANVALLLVAGHETTTRFLGNATLALLRHPDQLRDVLANPDLWPAAVDELMRFDGPGQWTTRLTGEPVELSGITIPRGKTILASAGSANRDPDVFANPDRLDLRRANAHKHLGFGAGIHFCLGAALAKLESEIALQTLFSRFKNIRLATSKLKWQPGLVFRGVKSLPLTFSPT